MRATFRILVILLAGAAITWGLRLTVFAPEPVPVTVFRVAYGIVEEIVTNSRAGTVKTRRRSSLSPEVGGRAIELPVRKGDRVEEGDLLLRLWDGAHLAQVELQRRSVQTANAIRDEACLAEGLALRELERARSLAEDDIVSVDRLDKAQSRYDMAQASCVAARAGVRSSRAALALARAELERTVIRAPFGGIIAELRAEIGEYVTPGAPGVFIPAVIDLIDPAAIYISAPLDEVDLGRVSEGLPVRVTLDPHPDRAERGLLTRIASYVEDAKDQNRTFEVEIELEDSVFAGQLLPGTTADIEVVLAAKADALRIPSYALLQGERVLVVRDEKLVSLSVATGLRNWQFVEITSGLTEGELVVVSLDRAEVEEGAFVEVADETLK